MANRYKKYNTEETNEKNNNNRYSHWFYNPETETWIKANILCEMNSYLRTSHGNYEIITREQVEKIFWKIRTS